MPSVSVVGIVTKLKNRKVVILLMPRNIEPYKGKWSLPLFHIDRFERAIDSVQRELKEKTGLTYSARFFGYFDEIIQSDDLHEVVLAFECFPTGKLMGEDDDELEDLDWFSIEEAKSLPLAFDHNKILEEYTNQRKGGVARYLGKHIARYAARWIGIRFPTFTKISLHPK